MALPIEAIEKTDSVAGHIGIVAAANELARLGMVVLHRECGASSVFVLSLMHQLKVNRGVVLARSKSNGF
ncbi:hypothetical protein [uncultured Deefgea sp.]|uniref:hypothetical protein n=1 Tax=uncultured Deefgea sp. TaxID=1304914 RepID=UPI0025969484|nr:hypothetical protein [uncultured Deefgea sp.]